MVCALQYPGYSLGAILYLVCWGLPCWVGLYTNVYTFSIQPFKLRRVNNRIFHVGFYKRYDVWQSQSLWMKHRTPSFSNLVSSPLALAVSSSARKCFWSDMVKAVFVISLIFTSKVEMSWCNDSCFLRSFTVRKYEKKLMDVMSLASWAKFTV